jgi:hypothetical protein
MCSFEMSSLSTSASLPSAKERELVFPYVAKFADKKGYTQDVLSG